MAAASRVGLRRGMSASRGGACKAADRVGSGALFGLYADRDDEVAGHGGADVLQAVHDVGRGKDHVARAGGNWGAVVDELEVALADEQELGVAVFVGWVGHLAGGEEGLVDLDELSCGKRAGEDLTAAAAVGVVFYGKLAVTEDDGLRELAIGTGRRTSLRLGHNAAESREGGQGNTEITAIDIFHAGILRDTNYIGHPNLSRSKICGLERPTSWCLRRSARRRTSRGRRRYF